MGKKKKKRRKQLRRTQRLSGGKSWLKNYEGAEMIEDYKKHYGVDLLCAVIELRLLGAEISKGYEYQLRQEEVSRRFSKKSKKKGKDQTVEEVLDGFSDGRFAFIAGYTPGGVPFGLTHEEMEMLSGDTEKIE